jgi:hypothetical protein
MTAISTREFNQNTGRAKQLADEEPLFVTTGGKVRYVLLNFEEYQKMMHPRRTLADVLGMSEEDYFEFEFPRDRGLPRETDLGDFDE